MHVHGYSCVSLYSGMDVYCLTSGARCEQEQRKAQLRLPRAETTGTGRRPVPAAHPCAKQGAKSQ
ncbi:hypothetical protein BGY98DRAFT_1031236 [Russula aff. rugulosa BPL654]|nr:hypothetical protein BGY98DRAFT_1031236 [Russula aff. rugulosa BPL654]